MEVCQYCQGELCRPDTAGIWTSLSKLRAAGQLCDAVLLADEQRFPVHRVIMVSGSEYFRALFTNGMKETSQVEVEIPGIDAETLGLIIDYIYTRSIRLTEFNVRKVLPNADSLLVSGLVEKCCAFLASTISVHNCIGILLFSDYYNCFNLNKTVRKYININFYDIATTSIEFLDLQLDDLMNLISSDELNVRTEEDVFEAIIRWLEHKPLERKGHISTLLQHVRLGLLHADYFVDKVSEHPFVKEYEHQCLPAIRNALDFLKSIDLQGNKHIDLKNPLVRPRIPYHILFAIGGWSGGSPISFFESYDTRADRWYTHSLLEDNSPRAYHGLVALNKFIYLVGGFDGTQYFNNVRCFDPVNKVWKDAAPMYSQRCYISTTVLDGCIYACGGYDGRWRLSSVERYCPQTNQWTQLKSMHKRRSDAGCDVLNGLVYVVGGFDGDQCLDTGEVYCTQADQWTLLDTTMSRQRSGVSVVSYHGSLYALGGFDGDRRMACGERYDPEIRSWSRVPDMYTPRSNCAVVVLDDMIFVIGGFNGSFTIPHVECYDGETGEWYDATDMNINRSALRACVVADLPNVHDYSHYGHIDDRRDEKSDS